MERIKPIISDTESGNPFVQDVAAYSSGPFLSKLLNMVNLHTPTEGCHSLGTPHVFLQFHRNVIPTNLYRGIIAQLLTEEWNAPVTEAILVPTIMCSAP